MCFESLLCHPGGGSAVWRISYICEMGPVTGDSRDKKGPTEQRKMRTKVFILYPCSSLTTSKTSGSLLLLNYKHKSRRFTTLEQLLRFKHEKRGYLLLRSKREPEIPYWCWSVSISAMKIRLNLSQQFNTSVQGQLWKPDGAIMEPSWNWYDQSVHSIIAPIVLEAW